MKVEAGEARYIYCVAPGGEELSLGEIGVEGKQVYTLPYKDICALVHDCPPQPYSLENEHQARAWLLAHEQVVEMAWGRWGTVLPLGFNTIIPDTASDASQLRSWLEAEYEHLKQKLDNLHGKAEYGVQIFWDPTTIAAKIEEASPELQKLKEEINSKPRGVAYMYRQKLQRLLDKELEAKARESLHCFYQQILQHSDSLHLERSQGGLMLINLSCLVAREKYPGLSQELDRINTMGGFSVRFSGPWPPYSFC